MKKSKDNKYNIKKGLDFLVNHNYEQYENYIQDCMVCDYELDFMYDIVRKWVVDFDGEYEKAFKDYKVKPAKKEVMEALGKFIVTTGVNTYEAFENKPSLLRLARMNAADEDLIVHLQNTSGGVIKPETINQLQDLTYNRRIVKKLLKTPFRKEICGDDPLTVDYNKLAVKMIQDMQTMEIPSKDILEIVNGDVNENNFENYKKFVMSIWKEKRPEKDND